MIAWKKQIPSQKRLELASYIMSMQGTNPADPRQPEGVKAGEEGPATTPQDSVETPTEPNELLEGGDNAPPANNE